MTKLNPNQHPIEHSLYHVNQAVNFYPAGKLMITSEKRVHLEPKINAIIHLLIERVNMTVDRDSLVDFVWSGKSASNASITRAISMTRRTLADLNLQKEIEIENIYGFGYCLHAEVQKKLITSGDEIYTFLE